jgi:hypothetical protein
MKVTTSLSRQYIPSSVNTMLFRSTDHVVV